MAREYRVPLTDDAVAVLRGLPRFKGATYVFSAPCGGMLSDMSISAVMRCMHEAGEKRLAEQDRKAGREPPPRAQGYLDSRSKRPAVPHGPRSFFRDWVSELTSYPGEMANVALAHERSATPSRRPIDEAISFRSVGQ